MARGHYARLKPRSIIFRTISRHIIKSRGPVNPDLAPLNAPSRIKYVLNAKDAAEGKI